MNDDVLLIYASKHGHTAKIATRIAEALRADGIGADVLDASDAGEVSLADYRAVVVGASIHAGHHEAEVIDWVKRHASALSGMPSAFFSVCLTAAEEDEESRATAHRFLDEFVEETGWTPTVATTFAGALQYLEYGFITRTLMRAMMKRGGHPTDTSRDYDYTDWNAVEEFGHEFARNLTV